MIFVSSESDTIIIGSLTQTIPKPSGVQQGDLLCIHMVGFSINGHPLSATGGLEILSDDYGEGDDETDFIEPANGTAYYQTLLYKVIDGTEGEDFDITFSNTTGNVHYNSFVYRPEGREIVSRLTRVTGALPSGAVGGATGNTFYIGTEGVPAVPSLSTTGKLLELWWSTDTSDFRLEEGANSGTLRYSTSSQEGTSGSTQQTGNLALFDSDGVQGVEYQTFDMENFNRGDDTEAAFGAWSFGLALIETAQEETPVKHVLSESVGSISDAVSLIPSEVTTSEAFFADQDLDTGSLKEFSHFLRPSEQIAVYYPRPTNNFEILNTFRGETKLRRMELSYPAPLLILASDIAGNTDGLVTPQQAIEYLFSVWAGEFDWFTYETVPDLRVHRADQDYSGDNGQLGLGAIILPQELPLKSMKQIADEFLELFAGTKIRQNSLGNIELVPAIGPDAPTVTKTLTWADIRRDGLSEGKPDPTQIYNAARGTASFVEESDNFQVLNPSWFGRRSDEFFPDKSSEWFDPPGDRDNLSPAGNRFGGLLEPIKLVDDVLITSGSAISFTHPDTSADLISGNIRWGITTSTSAAEEAIAATSLTALPTDGNWHRVALFTKTFDTLGFIPLGTVRMEVYMRYDAAGRQIEVELRSEVLEGVLMAMPAPDLSVDFGSVMFEVYIDGYTTVFAYTEKAISASYGIDSEDTLPDTTGADIIEASQTLYGRREAVVNSSVFPLTSTDLALVLQGIVLANIEPRVVREIILSNWDGVTLEPDDIGHPVTLPNTETVTIQSYNYQASHQTQGSLVDSVEGRQIDPNSTIELDDPTCYWSYKETGDFLTYKETGDFIEFKECS